MIINPEGSIIKIIDGPQPFPIFSPVIEGVKKEIATHQVHYYLRISEQVYSEHFLQKRREKKGVVSPSMQNLS